MSTALRAAATGELQSVGRLRIGIEVNMQQQVSPAQLQTQTAATEISPVPTRPNLDPGLWTIVGTALWLLLAAIVLLALRHRIVDLLDAIVRRIRSGAALKIFDIELGPIRVSPQAPPSSPLITEHQYFEDLEIYREGTYEENNLVFLVHRLFPSEVAGQLYDVLIYLVPHEDREGTLRNVVKVEYYFGSHWGRRVFSTSDKGRRFGIVVSAYGKGFLCCAKITFSGGQEVKTWRYIDFEMGPLGNGGIGLKNEPLDAKAEGTGPSRMEERPEEG